MNGLALEPDHGFPVRLIVPGQIGGRMVKWLKRIEISETESNHYVSCYLRSHNVAANLGSSASLLGFVASVLCGCSVN